ncbi:MAG: SusC/RagA family TonB-linked outer membrane protein, partial [Candidatus Cryptobacteroides sp.]
NSKVNVTTTSTDMARVLDDVFGDTGISWRISGTKILLSPGTKPATEPTRKPTLLVKGRVLDENGEPLIGVSVVEDGTNNTVITDLDGYFAIYNVASESSVLKFSYISYASQSIKVGQQRNLIIRMSPDTESLDEVVVVGYATQKRESVIGAISTVRPQTLVSAQQTRSLSNSLAGQIAGVIAVQRSGQPGFDNSDFWIRGISTFGTNSHPLVIVDGVERDLNNIAAEEIESFSVLKDATATAVYGVRGANGVIIIQTKRGQIGKPRISIKADYGLSNPTKLPEFVDAAKYMEVLNDAAILSGVNPIYPQERIDKTRAHIDNDLYPDVNWLDLICTRNNPNFHVSADINGGSDRVRYSLIIAAMHENGMMPTDDATSYNSKLRMTRYNVRSNVDINLTPSTVLDVSIGGNLTDRTRGGITVNDLFAHALDTPPNAYPSVYSNGQFPKAANRYNPWVEATQTGYARIYTYTLQSVIGLTQDFGKIWEPLKGLKLKGLFSFDAYSYNYAGRTRTPPYFIATGRDEEGNLITSEISHGAEFLSFSQTSNGNRTEYGEFRLNYNRKFGKHTVEGLFMGSLRDYYNGATSNSELALPYRDAGIAGRAAYSWNDRYFAEFNFGYNGSENFKRGYRFGFFPSFAAGWLVSNEKWWEGTRNVISMLKLRASWGMVGNDDISSSRRFGYLATIDSTTGYTFGNDGRVSYSGYQEGDFGIEDLTWETSEKANIGLEMSWFNMLNIQVDIFREMRKNIFMQRQTIPETAGFNVMPYANFGRVRNQGIEISLDLNKQISPDFHISAKGNFTFARNVVLEIDESTGYKNSTLAQTGRPMYTWYGYIADRLYRDSDFLDPEAGILRPDLPISDLGTVKPGDIKYVDLNGNGHIDTYDRTAIGHPKVPEIVYGFGVSGSWKGIDLSLFFQGAANFSNMLHGTVFIPGSGGGARGNIYANADDRWTPEYPSSDVFYPRLSSSPNNNNNQYSSWWLRNAAYLRLKNLEAGYSFPKRWIQKAKMRNARIFFRGTNLLTFAAFDMWDPEIGSQDGFDYPLMKMYALGVEFTF